MLEHSYGPEAGLDIGLEPISTPSAETRESAV
jgi:hypothetical protein